MVIALWAVMFPYILFSQTADPALDAAADAGQELPASEAEAQAAEAAEARSEAERLLVISDDVPDSLANPSSAMAIFRMILVLALVAVVIYLVVFFLRRLTKPQAEQNPHLKILASTYLGSGRSVHVISVGTKAWLIGSGEGGINHIADLNEQEAVDAMLLDSSAKTAEADLNPIQSFKAMLKKLSGGVSSREQDRLEKMRQRRERFKRF
jgi:flagellar protein FliO/FliZ